LTPEGQTVFDTAERRKANPWDLGYSVPAMDYPIDTGLAVVNCPHLRQDESHGSWNHPLDIYAQLGYGKTNLSSGLTDTYSAGGGVGLWWSQWVASRLEARYQTYQDQVYSGLVEKRLLFSRPHWESCYEKISVAFRKFFLIMAFVTGALTLMLPLQCAPWLSI